MTAVEFLESQYKFNGQLFKSDFQQAKAMEKEQTIEFANEYSRAVIGGCLLTRTEFYNETFKSE